MSAKRATSAFQGPLRSRRLVPPPVPFGSRWSSSNPTAQRHPLAPQGPPNDKASLPSETSVEGTAQRAKANDEPPPYLPRPLGVPEPPHSRPLTAAEKRHLLASEERIKKERQHLLREIGTGYYHDWATLRKTPKLWTGPPSLIIGERALYFPDIEGISLATSQNVHTTDLCRGKVSLIAFETTRMSAEHTTSYSKELMDILGKDPDLQLIRINVQENPLKSWLVSLFLSSLRRSVPPEQHPLYLLSQQNLEYLREPLGCVNKLIGYVYLVDQNCKIRWAACEFATHDEHRGLAVSTRLLLERLKYSRGEKVSLRNPKKRTTAGDPQ